jgi:hypothetical protein
LAGLIEMRWLDAVSKTVGRGAWHRAGLCRPAHGAAPRSVGIGADQARFVLEPYAQS